MSKICNTKVEVPAGLGLNDKDFATSLLSTLKEMEKNYCLAMTEASNEWLYSIYRDIFLDIADMQRRLYLLMFRRGWYIMEEVSQTKLDEKNKMLGQDYQGLGE